MNKYISELYKSRHVLGQMVKRNIKNQYRNSVLGILWTILNPLLYMIVLSLVFSQFFGKGLGSGISYPVYLLTGNIIFTLMTTTTTSALCCIINNSGLITKVKIPYYVFPTSLLLSNTVNFGFSYLCLVGVMIVLGQQFFWTTIFVLVLLPALLLFVLGLSYILCTLYVFFRDIKHIYTVVVTLWMYLTPLFWIPESIFESGSKISQIIPLNPMYQFIEYFRSIMIYGNIPSAISHLIIYAWGIGIFLLGWLFFKWKKRKFILHI